MRRTTHTPTIAEIAEMTGLNQNEVREVVEALQVQGVLEVLEPGDRIVAAVQYGLPTRMAPNDFADLAPEADLKADRQDTKG